MSTNWKAGDKALCVDDTICPGCEHLSMPLNKGSIYLVRGVIAAINPAKINVSGIGLYLAGITQETQAYTGREIAFSCERFRKIVPACDRATNQEEGLIPHEGFWEGRK